MRVRWTALTRRIRLAICDWLSRVYDFVHPGPTAEQLAAELEMRQQLVDRSSPAAIDALFTSALQNAANPQLSVGERQHWARQASKDMPS